MEAPVAPEASDVPPDLQRQRGEWARSDPNGRRLTFWPCPNLPPGLLGQTRAQLAVYVEVGVSDEVLPSGRGSLEAGL